MEQAYPLKTLLSTMPYKALRGVVTRFGLHGRQLARKHDWQGWIVDGWHNAAQRRAWLELLPPVAQRALIRLLRAEQIPASLFWAEFGEVRQPTAGQTWSPAPWQEPANASEALYYSGLLYPVGSASLARCQQVALPSDLHPLLMPMLVNIVDNSVSSPPTNDDALLGLCHDVGQCLIAQMVTSPGRWLSRNQRHALNQRLWQPLPTAALLSRARSDYLRLLTFLAVAGDLQNAGEITPQGWAWLAEPPPVQLWSLWRAWRSASAALRQQYQPPAATLGEAWLQVLLKALLQLADQPAFQVVALTDALLRANDLPAAFWAAHFGSLTAVDELLAQVCVELLLPLGILVQGAGGYRLTSVGYAWLTGDAATLAAPSSPTAQLHHAAEGAALLVLDIPAQASLQAQAQVALFARYLAPPTRHPQLLHHYQLSLESVAKAAAEGHGLPPLHGALATVGVPLTPALLALLHGWHEQGQQVRLIDLPLLRTKKPSQLAALLQEPTLQRALGDVLSPTTAVVTEPFARFAHRLQTVGYAVAVPSQADEPATDAATAGALWLAGRVYALLGQHLALPVPPPFAELDRLWAGLSPAQSSVLQAQLATVQEQLLDLLDNLPFTPPAQPSDPAQWIEPIQQAIADQQTLWIVYFSAGRNLSTRRLVEPYWLEEQRGVSYLRAYCHSAGRVLTFRLDRIESVVRSP